MSDPERSTVLYEVDSDIATITLNRPHAKNALSTALQRDLVAAFDRATQDEEVRVVVLTGAGNAFCAGVDLKEFGQLEGNSESRHAETAWDAMSRCMKPIIGAVNGPAITGGFEIALACDVLIAGESARFADTHGRVGVLPGAGLSQRLPRAIGIYRAKYLSLTGNFLSAQTAEEWGLVSHVVPDESLLATAREVAQDMLGLVPYMLPGLKAMLDDGFDLPFGEAMGMEATRAREQMKAMKPQKAASAAFAGVRERGRAQKD